MPESALIEALSGRDQNGSANLILAFKATGCAECGRRYPEVDWSDLHVDHVQPRHGANGRLPQGHRAVGAASRMSRMKAAECIAELLECQVLCRWCHKGKHRNGHVLGGVQMPLFSGSGSWTYTPV